MIVRIIACSSYPAGVRTPWHTVLILFSKECVLLKTKIISSIAILFASILVLCLCLCAAPAVSADRYLVMNAETGQILFGKNVDAAAFPASVANIMTAYAACMNTRMDVYYKINDASGDDIGFISGESPLAEDLIHSLVMKSSRVAAQALAEGISGDAGAYIELMNQTASGLGAVNTVYTDIFASDDVGQLTTARDTGIILSAALKNESFRDAFMSENHSISTSDVRKKLIEIKKDFVMLDEYEGLIGGVSDISSLSGCVAVAAAERNGITLIAVVFGSTSKDNMRSDLSNLLDYGFDNYSLRHLDSDAISPRIVKVVDNGLVVGSAAVYPDDISFYLHNDIDFSLVEVTEDIQDTYNSFAVNPSVTVGVPQMYSSLMFPDIGTFRLGVDISYYENTTPVDPVPEDPAPKKEKEPFRFVLTEGLRKFITVMMIVFLAIGVLLVVYLISERQRRKKDRLRRLRRQEMYEKAHHDRNNYDDRD